MMRAGLYTEGLRGMCLAMWMWRSKHPTMTIRPELTVTPYRATSCHQSASAVGNGDFFLPRRGAWARGRSVKAFDD
jgi:hypothetical protein